MIWPAIEFIRIRVYVALETPAGSQVKWVGGKSAVVKQMDDAARKKLESMMSGGWKWRIESHVNEPFGSICSGHVRFR